MDNMKGKEDLKEAPTKNHTSLVLAFSLAVVTLGLVLLAVLGSVYVVGLQKERNLPEETPHYKVKHQENERVVYEDPIEQVEKIQRKDLKGNIVSTTILDYQSRMITVHMEKENRCFLIGGIVEEIGSFTDDIPVNVSIVDSADDITEGFVYVIRDTNPVNKMSLVASDLRHRCTNTNTLWVERKDVELHREKRKAPCDCVYIIICSCGRVFIVRG